MAKPAPQPPAPRSPPFVVKSPWWASLIGVVRRWLRERAERKAALIEHHRPRYVITINGVTKWNDAGYEQISHSWTLYESAAGRRTVSHTEARWVGPERLHPVYGQFIAPWLGYQIDILPAKSDTATGQIATRVRA